MTYQVHLSEFEGPLDLLLHLIERSELDIKDIFVSEITNEYLAYMRGLDSVDMEFASEFLTMAATLVYIKSRSLLPKAPVEDDEGEDPEEALIRRLREYKAFKEASDALELLRSQALGAYTKLPEEFMALPADVTLKDTSVDALCRAFFAVLSREANESHEIAHEQISADEFTVRRQRSMLRQRLLESGALTFSELFCSNSTKTEIIVTFMALMDMLSHGEITLAQDELYGEITIAANSLMDDEGADSSYMDE